MRNWLKRTLSASELELERLLQTVRDQKPGTDEYKEALAELKSFQEFCGHQKEQKQFLDKQGRGNVLGKVVGFLGLGGLAFGLAKFEKNGNFFSGSSNNVISGIVKIGTRFFG